MKYQSINLYHQLNYHYLQKLYIQLYQLFKKNNKQNIMLTEDVKNINKIEKLTNLKMK